MANINNIPDDLVGTENRQIFYQYLVDINFNPIILQQIKNLIEMELTIMVKNSASVKFYSNLINYVNKLNFEKNDFKNLTDIFGMIIELGITIIRNFVKKENSDDP